MKGKQLTTIYDQSTGKTMRLKADLNVLDESILTHQIESNVVCVYPTYSFQTFEGYGCAMTESSCWLLA